MTELLAKSADGTKISSEIFGQGRPLVIVSGALFARERWQAVIPLLSVGRSPCVIDRRGRGRSGDGAVYAPDCEVADILAVLAALSDPVDMLGHSSGAILALQVAARVPPNLKRLIAYEPPVFFADSDCIAQDLPERLDALLAGGQTEAAVETFLREGPRLSETELNGLRGSAHWSLLVRTLAHTVPYDARLQRAFTADATELASVTIPTLMLLGSASPERMQSGAKTIAARLPNARTVELAGQQHGAMLSAPALFAAALNDFLAASSAAQATRTL
jgi:pimeloyl-ACP methyl ester carboxylesterase